MYNLKIKKVLRILSAFTWELPQTIIGLIILLWIGNLKMQWNGYCWFVRFKKGYFGVGIGPFAMLSFDYPVSNYNTLLHEAGHSLQSLFLGPLFIPVVAIPSVVMNVLTRLKVLKHENYYKRFPENWASMLGESTLR